MNAPAITQCESLTGLALPLAAVFVMAVGYGVVLPVLPYATIYPAMLIGVGLVAAASGLLIPALAYLVSLAAGWLFALLSRRRSGRPPACLGSAQLLRCVSRTD